MSLFAQCLIAVVFSLATGVSGLSLLFADCNQCPDAMLYGIICIGIAVYTLTLIPYNGMHTTFHKKKFKG